LTATSTTALAMDGQVEPMGESPDGALMQAGHVGHFARTVEDVLMGHSEGVEVGWGSINLEMDNAYTFMFACLSRAPGCQLHQM
jgi:hypothetical protein